MTIFALNARCQRGLLLLLLLVNFTGCSIFGGKEEDTEREKTVRNLQLLESRFPFGSYAEQAQLEIVYAYHKSGDDDAAIAAAERFLRLHPGHPDADYAWYMKGLANYTLKPGLLARFYKPDYSSRDVEPARQSFREFQQFISRYPDSPYAADARVRLIHVKQVLARHEITVANYYIKRHAYIAAINRATAVIEQYPQTEATGDALAVLAYAYSRAGLDELAKKNIALLQQNFPQHAALDAQGGFRYGSNFDPERRSTINRVSFGFFDAPRAPRFDSRES
jgi:outer membrane protein assembly factor BamD